MQAPSLCQICHNQFDSLNRQPRRLPCGHVLCIDCIATQFYTTRQVICPSDHSIHTSPPHIYPIQEIESSGQGPNAQKCHLHGQDLDFFCFDDMLLICNGCAMEGLHDGHRRVHVSQACSDLSRTVLRDAQDKVNRLLSVVDTNIAQCQQESQETRRSALEIEAVIISKCEEIMQSLLAKRQESLTFISMLYSQIQEIQTNNESKQQQMKNELNQLRNKQTTSIQEILEYITKVNSLDPNYYNVKPQEAYKFNLLPSRQSIAAVTQEFFNVQYLFNNQPMQHEPADAQRAQERSRQQQEQELIRQQQLEQQRMQSQNQKKTYGMIKFDTDILVEWDLDTKQKTEKQIQCKKISKEYTYVFTQNDELILTGGKDDKRRLTHITGGYKHEGKMNQERYIGHSVEEMNGQIFILGGNSSYTDPSSYLDKCEMYNKNSKKSLAAPSIPYKVACMGNASNSTQMFLFGGITTGIQTIDKISTYNMNGWMENTSLRLPEKAGNVKSAWYYNRQCCFVYSAFSKLKQTSMFDINSISRHGPDYPINIGRYQNYNGVMYQDFLYNVDFESLGLYAYDVKLCSWSQCQ